MSIKILIVDDSSFAREVLREVIESSQDMEVIGEASNGLEALRLIPQLEPDVVTMDVVMPMKGGLETVSDIMYEHAIPVVMISGADSLENLEKGALKSGAVDVFLKPTSGFDEDSRLELLITLRRAAVTRVSKTTLPTCNDFSQTNFNHCEVLGIVSSTGGPRVLLELLKPLPRTLPFPIVIVQHTTAGFANSLVEWLDRSCALRVRLGSQGGSPAPGEVVIAPDGRHLKLSPSGGERLSDAPPIHSLRPAGDPLLESIAHAFGSRGAGLVLTGMGRDGTAGLRAIADAGGIALVQNLSEATVTSMPNSAYQAVPEACLITIAALAAHLKESV